MGNVSGVLLSIRKVAKSVPELVLSFEYGIVKWCQMPDIEARFHSAFPAESAHTVFAGNNSTYQVNVSMNTTMNLKVITSGSGPMVSMAILCIGRRVEKTKRAARIT